MLAVLAGCGGPKRGAGEAHRANVPANLRVTVNDHSMQVRWEFNRTVPISGYNIYISETPLAGHTTAASLKDVAPWNSAPYPGDTNPEDSTIVYDATGLENGVKYYVSVCAVFPDETLSKLSREVVAVCGPRGEIELAVRYNGHPDGFSFAKNEYVDADASTNDLYYFSQNGNDYLDSPARLDGFLRKTGFEILGFSGNLDAVISKINGSKRNPTLDRVEVAAGDWVLLKTADDTYALVHVEAATGSGTDRRIKLAYAYSAIKDRLLF